MECTDVPYDNKTVLANVTKARKEKRDGGEPEDQDNKRRAKKRKHDEDRSLRRANRDRGISKAGGTSAGLSLMACCDAPGSLELLENLGHGISGIVYRGR